MKPLNWLNGTFWLVYCFVVYGWRRIRPKAEILPMDEFVDRLLSDIEI
jgi:hypothetical protein